MPDPSNSAKAYVVQQSNDPDTVQNSLTSALYPNDHRGVRRVGKDVASQAVAFPPEIISVIETSTDLANASVRLRHVACPYLSVHLANPRCAVQAYRHPLPYVQSSAQFLCPSHWVQLFRRSSMPTREEILLDRDTDPLRVETLLLTAGGRRDAGYSEPSIERGVVAHVPSYRHFRRRPTG